MTKLNYRFSWIASCLLITSLLASNAATADDVLLPDVVHSKHECKAQGKDFGDIPLTQCLKGAADNSSVCASAVMFSKVFPFWRCRCCAVDTADKLPGNAHNLWDIYTLSTRPIEKLQAALETATKACKGASTPENALAAAALTRSFGVPAPAVGQGLRDLHLGGHRIETVHQAGYGKPTGEERERSFGARIHARCAHWHSRAS